KPIQSGCEGFKPLGQGCWFLVSSGQLNDRLKAQFKCSSEHQIDAVVAYLVTGINIGLHLFSINILQNLVEKGVLFGTDVGAAMIGECSKYLCDCRFCGGLRFDLPKGGSVPPKVETSSDLRDRRQIIVWSDGLQFLRFRH